MTNKDRRWYEISRVEASENLEAHLNQYASLASHHVELIDVVYVPYNDKTNEFYYKVIWRCEIEKI